MDEPLPHSEYALNASLYDAVYAARGKDYAAEARFVGELIWERHGPAASVLDVACGTGLHLAHLPRTFVRSGLDLEAAFVEIAKGRVPQAAFSVGDMRALRVEVPVDAIVCMFSAIGHLPDTPALEATLARFAAAVKPGGTIIVEPWVFPEDWMPGFHEVVVVDEPGRKAARVAASRIEGRTTVLHYAFAVSDERGARAFEEPHRLTLFRQEEYVAAFERAGLSVDLVQNELFGRGLFIGRRPTN